MWELVDSFCIWQTYPYVIHYWSGLKYKGLTNSLTHDAEVPRYRWRDGEAEGHDGEGDDAASDGRDASGRRPEDGDDGETESFIELDKVIVSDANAPPDELEEDEGDEDSDESTMFDQELLQPGSNFTQHVFLANQPER